MPRSAKPSAADVPERRREKMADALQRVLAVLPEAGDHALRSDLLAFAEEFRGLRTTQR